jgi:hypothetical protein
MQSILTNSVTKGNFKVYRPPVFFKELPNGKIGQRQTSKNSSIEQYKDEERSVLAKRILSAENRISRLLKLWARMNLRLNLI